MLILYGRDHYKFTYHHYGKVHKLTYILGYAQNVILEVIKGFGKVYKITSLINHIAISMILRITICEHLSK